MSIPTTDLERPELAPAEAEPDLVALYESERGRLLRLCTAILRDPDDAEDAVQETFIRVGRIVSRLTGDPAVFLRVIARNYCRDQLRRRRSHPVERLSSGETVEMTGEVLDSSELADVWCRLTCDDRRLLAQSFAGYSYEEIAASSGRSPKSVSVGLFRARQRARQLAVALGAALSALLVRQGWLRRAGARPALGPSTALLATAVVSVGLLTSSVQPSGPSAPRSPGQTAGGVDLDQLTDTAARPPQGTLSSQGDGPGTPRGGPTAAAAPAGGSPVAAAAGANHGLDAGALAASALDPTGNAQPDDTGFTGFTPSPAYSRDHTVFATGTVVNGCPAVRPCPVIFRTTDGGHSWTNLHSTGYLGGPVMLPPGFPADPTLFASSPAGLEQSNDGGRSFTVVLPLAGPMAIDPSSPARASRVVVGGQPTAVYDQATGTARSGPALPVAVTSVDAVTYAAAGALLVAGREPDALAVSGYDRVVVACATAATGCRETLRAADGRFTQITASPHVEQDGVVVASDNSSIWVSRDSGESFHAGLGDRQLALAFDPGFDGGGAIIGAEPNAAVDGRPQPLLLVSRDLGASFVPVPQAGLENLARQVAFAEVLPDGHVLAALSATPGGGFGIRCAVTLQAGWAPSC